MVQRCLLLLLILSAVLNGVHSQPGFDSNGFLSIDCGLSGTSSYVDSTNKLTYYSDDNFIDTGFNSKIAPGYGADLHQEFQTVRYFPNGTRNCYTIRSLTNGLNYLIRATFYYENYDLMKNPPTFDIYLGVNFWSTVEYHTSYTEIIINATADFLDVCLVNKGQGTPSISSLHLRTFKEGMYPFVDSMTSLILVERIDMGGNTDFVGYPDDKFDRWWRIDKISPWKNISFNSNNIHIDPTFQTPPAVLQTAATSSSTLQPLTLLWDSDDPSTTYYIVLHFYDQKPTTGRREFNIIFNGELDIFPLEFGGWAWITYLRSGYSNYNVSLVATSNSTLPPLLNANELYIAAPVGITTYADDVTAIKSVKEYYRIKKGWSGDPCFPKHFSWTGINCSTDSTSNTTRITSLDISSSLLTGSLSDSIGKMTDLKYLYLSNNNLSGPLPISLDSLTSLTILDIRGNPHISTVLPPGLHSRQQSNLLLYRYGNFTPSPPPPPPSPPPHTPIIIIAIAVGVPLMVIAVVVALVLVLKRAKDHTQSTVRNQNECHQPDPQQNYHANVYANTPQVENLVGTQKRETKQIFPKFVNRKFSYGDLKQITNDFKINIGTGGYGKVYLGQLENKVQVAVKMLSESSQQGVKEFLAEAENLSKVHHRNLVALVGYSTDQSCMALVYPYMQEGNLHDKLNDNAAPLSWKQRLQIAYESALGLEYMHKACDPPLIHRDIKTTNILLNANLEPKIADFGLCRAFNNVSSQVSTRVVGTIGYLDPEYYLSNKPSAKSDVYSFGVVLLEIITGKVPTGEGIEGGNLVQWVRRQRSAGDIEAIVDPKLQDNYEINSVLNVIDLACKCTEATSPKRPTMSEVVTNLKECLDIETSMDEIHIERTYNLPTDVSQNSNFEMAYMGGMPLNSPRVR